AVKAGVVTGMGDGTFRPNDRITREQMAVMVARALRSAGKSTAADRVDRILAGFSDKSRISGWARDGVAAAADAGIVKGRDGGAFAPADNATRAEAAAMLKRYLGSVGQL
ncbi:MAG: S-layer homology domain-containing protein, partial [Armatimonadota bacterium]|nr:S-layer homology domain-containing protein [Armatimonadota bacterium]